MNKEYEVCGPTEILGHSSGVKFTADLLPYQEKTLIEGGGLRLVEPAVTELQGDPQVEVKDDPDDKQQEPPPESAPPIEKQKGKF
jgi:hypothetical protein